MEIDKKSRRRGIRGGADVKANNATKYPKTESQMEFLKQVWNYFTISSSALSFVFFCCRRSSTTSFCTKW